VTATRTFPAARRQGRYRLRKSVGRPPAASISTEAALRKLHPRLERYDAGVLGHVVLSWQWFDWSHGTTRPGKRVDQYDRCEMSTVGNVLKCEARHAPRRSGATGAVADKALRWPTLAVSRFVPVVLLEIETLQ